MVTWSWTDVSSGSYLCFFGLAKDHRVHQKCPCVREIESPIFRTLSFRVRGDQNFDLLTLRCHQDWVRKKNETHWHQRSILGCTNIMFLRITHQIMVPDVWPWPAQVSNSETGCIFSNNRVCIGFMAKVRASRRLNMPVASSAYHACSLFRYSSFRDAKLRL